MQVEIEGVIPPTVLVRDLQIGQAGVVVEEHIPYSGHVLLRIYGRIVSLNDPYLSWGEGCVLRVSPLKKGTIIKLTLTD